MYGLIERWFAANFVGVVTRRAVVDSGTRRASIRASIFMLLLWLGLLPEVAWLADYGRAWKFMHPSRKPPDTAGAIVHR